MGLGKLKLSIPEPIYLERLQLSPPRMWRLYSRSSAVFARGSWDSSVGFLDLSGGIWFKKPWFLLGS